LEGKSKKKLYLKKKVENKSEEEFVKSRKSM
jgi:hypothetical protein